MESMAPDPPGELEVEAEEIPTKKTNADYCRKYKTKMKAADPNYKAKEKERIAKYRAEKKAKQTDEERTAELKKDAERKREARRKRALVNITAEATASPYQRPQSLGKAMSRVIRHLPNSPHKRAAVFTGVARRIGVNLESRMNEEMKENSRRGLSFEDVECIKAYYTNPDIVYTMPGMRDEITVWEEGQKFKLRKYYLTVFLREAYSMFKEHHPNITVGFSKFCSLRPNNVLLLHDTPADQCRCKIHENFIFKLEGLRIQYDSTEFWETVLCDTSLNSKCWRNECIVCSNGKKIHTELDLGKAVQWREWKVADNDVMRRLQCICHEGCVGQLKELLVEEMPKVLQHINVKRIQATEFHEDQENPNVRILQMDFAMNYSCEYQDEVQSALWTRASVTLYTAAAMHGGKCQTFIICSDTKEKNKDTVAVFTDYLYQNHLIPDTQVLSTVEEVIWTDGPSSEFKNKFMVHLVRVLSAKYDRKFSWKYFATSHGKGVVDGVGGRAKSLVRAEVMSKKSNKTVVQSAKDFYDTAKRLMDKTVVLHLSHEEINIRAKEIVSWDDAIAIPGIQKMHVACSMSDGSVVNMYQHALDDEILGTVHSQDASISPLAVACSSGSYVAVAFEDGKWFPGQVLNIDSTTSMVEIIYMHPSGKSSYVWPKHEDKVFTNAKYIFANIVVNSKDSRGRLWAVQDSEHIQELYHTYAKAYFN